MHELNGEAASKVESGAGLTKANGGGCNSIRYVNVVSCAYFGSGYRRHDYPFQSSSLGEKEVFDHCEREAKLYVGV